MRQTPLTHQRLIDLIGEQAANHYVASLAAQGKRRRYVPHQPTPLFVELLGGDWQAAYKLCSEWGGDTYQIALRHQRTVLKSLVPAVQVLLQCGTPQWAIAAALKIKPQDVQQIKRDYGVPKRRRQSQRIEGRWQQLELHFC